MSMNRYVVVDKSAVKNKSDPVRKQADRGDDTGGALSPMDPPDALAPPSVDTVATEDLHPFLLGLKDGRAPLLGHLEAFEETLVTIRKDGYTKETDSALRHFFNFLDEEFAPRKRRAETALFALLHQRLMQHGEHSKEDDPSSAVDLMDDDYTKALQLGAVVVNFLGVAFRLPDQNSSLLVLDTALEQSKEMIELLRLIMFRMDNVITPLAHRLISVAEFDQMQVATAEVHRAH